MRRLGPDRVRTLAPQSLVIGEIDIDSDRLAAFGSEDQRFLEEVAALIAARS